MIIDRSLLSVLLQCLFEAEHRAHSGGTDDEKKKIMLLITPLADKELG